ncbi:hypothetical protein [Plantactinospora sp. CA-290183]|uniref:hypothetical protein n=1 Tax=Plantactinospora sp. CA-290183 TaxID=3240006 RepID=UPI003D946D48
MLHNSVTGDIIGNTWMRDGQFNVPVLGGQDIYLSYNVSDGGLNFDGPYVPCSGTAPQVFRVAHHRVLSAELVLCLP